MLAYNFGMVSRRRILLASAGLVLPFVNVHVARAAGERPAPASLGRVHGAGWAVRTTPATGGKLVRMAVGNEVLRLQYEVDGGAVGAHKNKLWFAVPGGFVHSAQIQPVENVTQPVEDAALVKAGFWGEVSIPVCPVRVAAGAKSALITTIFYGCIVRVNDVQRDANGEAWYRAYQGILSGGWVRATQIRRMLVQEFDAIHPDAIGKRITVDMQKSVVTAFEGNTEVFATPCATGSRKPNQVTPAGDWPVLYKKAGVHMQGDPKRGTRFDLPAVPFTTYFSSSTGASLHGTYWHSDWGGLRSAGCVNVNNAAARWLFRWTLPHVPYSVESWLPTQDIAAATVVSIKY